MEAKSVVEKLSNMKTTPIDAYLDLLKKLELDLDADRNYACEFCAKRGKSQLIGLIKDWKESNDEKQW